MTNYMLIDRVSQFFQDIRNNPEKRIDKNYLLSKIDEIIEKHPELEHHYQDIIPVDQISSVLTPIKESVVQSKDFGIRVDSGSSSGHSSAESSNDSMFTPVESEKNICQTDISVIKTGDLRITKDSSILGTIKSRRSSFSSYFSFKYESESKVHVELTTAYTENKQKVVTLNIYNMKKLKQLLHTFSLHQEYKFEQHDKKFLIKYLSNIDTFCTDSRDIAQQWIFALTGVISEPDQGSEYVICTPTMPSTHIPPPKLIPIPPQGRTKTVLYEPTSSDRLVNTIDFQQPENIYVCQYDNRKKSEHELEFNVGDLIYIVNTNGKNYNVGYKHDDRLRKMGLVYKGYIQPAYRKG